MARIPHNQIRMGSSPEHARLRWLVSSRAGGPIGCVVGPISGTTPFDGLNPTGLYSVSRKLTSSYIGDLYLLNAIHPPKMDTLYDQSGLSHNLTGIDVNIGDPSVVCFNSNPANGMQYFSGNILRAVGFTLGDFISATEGYLIISVKVDGIGASGANTMLFCGNWPLNPAGLFLDSATNKILAVNAFSGQTVDAPLTFGDIYVFEWRHEGGTLYLRVNGVDAGSIAATNTSPIVLADTLNLGGQFLSAGLNGYIWEAALFSAVPNLATRDALVQDMGAWAGAPV